MGKLPDIYQNDSFNGMNNNKDYYYSAYEHKNYSRGSSLTVNEELDRIFNGISHPFNEVVIIKTINKDYKTSLVYRMKDKVITIDNDTIDISSIISIIPFNNQYNSFD